MNETSVITANVCPFGLKNDPRLHIVVPTRVRKNHPMTEFPEVKLAFSCPPVVDFFCDVEYVAQLENMADSFESPVAVRVTSTNTMYIIIGRMFIPVSEKPESNQPGWPNPDIRFTTDVMSAQNVKKVDVQVVAHADDMTKEQAYFIKNNPMNVVSRLSLDYLKSEGKKDPEVQEAFNKLVDHYKKCKE